MDIKLYYEEKGQGDPLILLHGNGENGGYFVHQMKIDKAVLLGFSDGGNIALIFAMAHPERVEKLILNGANLNARGVKSMVQIPIEIGYRLASKFRISYIAGRPFYCQQKFRAV